MRVQSSDEAIQAAVRRAEPDLTPYFRLQWQWHRERVRAAAAEHFPTDIPEPTYARALVNWTMACDSWAAPIIAEVKADRGYIEFLLQELCETVGGCTVLPDPDGEAEAAQEQAEEARLEAQHQAELLREFRAGRL
jgi:hypothetical protein